MSRPVTSIVVCTYNRCELLADCLASLAAQDCDTDLYEVIIVDNGSTDRTLDVAGRFVSTYRNFRVVREENQGLSHARNRGWREAHGEIVAYIDDDARVTPGWCGRIIKAFDSVQPTPAAVGGTILPIYETSPPSWFSDEFEIRSKGAVARFLDPITERDGFSGSNMAFRKDVLARYGGFHTTLGMLGEKIRVGEETEFFQRISERDGLFWYDPDISVFHWTPRHNFTISYRFIRGYRGGEAAIHVQRRRLLSVNYAREFICLFRLILSAPYRLLVAKGHVKTEAARFIQEVGYKSGFLFGRKST